MCVLKTLSVKTKFSVKLQIEILKIQPMTDVAVAMGTVTTPTGVASREERTNMVFVH